MKPRLSLRKSPLGEVAFDMAQKAADLGLYTRLEAQFSCIPDVEYPWPVEIVQAIRRDFDPSFVPIFVREAWMTPAHTEVVIGRHMAGRYVPIPKSDMEPLNVLLPIHPVGGIRFQHPIIEAATFEDKEYDPVEEQTGGALRKQLGNYVPFDGRVYQTLSAIWWQNHNRRLKDVKREVANYKLDAADLAKKKALEDCRYALKNDWGRLERIRLAETDYDRQKAAAPPERKPFVEVRGAA